VEFSRLAGTQPTDKHVVAYDFGIKTNILRDLIHLGRQGHGRALEHTC
jgi:carbamoylphosphate synthase small subunit